MSDCIFLTNLHRWYEPIIERLTPKFRVTMGPVEGGKEALSERDFFGLYRHAYSEPLGPFWDAFHDEVDKAVQRQWPIGSTFTLDFGYGVHEYTVTGYAYHGVACGPYTHRSPEEILRYGVKESKCKQS